MSRLTLRLPETLHHKLANLAKSEGGSLNQYIVYALSCQIHNSYTINSLSEKEVEKQESNFNNLIKELGSLEDEEIIAILSEREMALPEDQLSKEIQDKLKLKIKNYGK